MLPACALLDPRGEWRWLLTGPPQVVAEQDPVEPSWEQTPPPYPLI